MSIYNWLAHIFEPPDLGEVTPSWLEIAFGDLGTLEKKGKEHNSRILEYHSNTTLNAGTDEVPWCASAVSTWLKEAGMKSLITSLARDYARYGHPCEPRFGCVVVFWRGSKESYKGHVGFYMGKVRDKLLVLGGNQNDAVTISEYPESRVMAYRWPAERSE